MLIQVKKRYFYFNFPSNLPCTLLETLEGTMFDDLIVLSPFLLLCMSFLKFSNFVLCITTVVQKAGQNMEHTLIAAYVAMLIGYLIIDNEVSV